MNKYNPLAFERWRKLMLVGALLLLVVTILKSSGAIGNGVLYAVGLGGGYALLVFGFGDSFRKRRAELLGRTKEKESDTPAEPTTVEREPEQ
ncbi:MAG: hypothetical protein ACRDLB_16020 [Actinomycetota bacterium]